MAQIISGKGEIACNNFFSSSQNLSKGHLHSWSMFFEGKILHPSILRDFRGQVKCFFNPFPNDKF